MKLSKIFKSTYSRGKTIQYERFVTIKLNAWEMCLQGDIRFVRLNYVEDQTEANLEDLNTWYDLQDQWVDKFSDDKKAFNRIVKLKFQLAKLKIDYVMDSELNRVNKNTIREIESELHKERDKETGLSMTELKVLLSQKAGYELRDDMPMERFFTHLKLAKNGG